MSTDDRLADDNIRLLQQALQLLKQIDNDTYISRQSCCFNSSIGGHFRHTFDHYRCFLNGLTTHQIDYDDRQRNETFETDRTRAIADISAVVEELKQLPEQIATTVVQVKMDGGCDRSLQEWVSSTAGRELKFLVSHDVHHYALVAFMLKTQGIEPPADFGVAPSTLRHLQSQQQ